MYILDYRDVVIRNIIDLYNIYININNVSYFQN